MGGEPRTVRAGVLRLGLMLAVAAAGLVGVYALSVWVVHRWPGGEALRYPWEAMRAFFFRGEDPYHRLTLLYGWSQRDGVAVAPQPYPFPMALVLFAPLALLKDFAVARAWAMWGAVLALAAVLALVARSLRWRLRGGEAMALGVFALVGYFSAVALLRADVAVLVLLLLTAALAALLDGRDDLAGVALALALIKPGVALYPALFLLLWSASRRRWRLWRGFWGGMAVLLALAFWLLPSWGLEMAFLLLRFKAAASPRLALVHAVPGVGRQVGWLLVAVVAAAVLAEWAASWGQSVYQAAWTTALTVVGALLIGGRVVPADQVLLLLPLLWVWAYWSSRWKTYGRPAAAVTLVLLGALPWLFWGGRLFSGSGVCASVGMCFFEPLVVWVLLYTVRWWATRPPVVLSPEALLE